MEDTVEVHLTLTRDTPDSMNFKDTRSGLDRVWYKFEAEPSATSLFGRMLMASSISQDFFKMARSGKRLGYHAHHTAEFGGDPGSQPEVIIAITDAPQGLFRDPSERQT